MIVQYRPYEDLCAILAYTSRWRWSNTPLQDDLVRSGYESRIWMRATEIIERLFGNKTVTADRVKKAQMLALRTRLEWSTVLAAMTPEQRAEVEKANA